NGSASVTVRLASGEPWVDPGGYSSGRRATGTAHVEVEQTVSRLELIAERTRLWAVGQQSLLTARPVDQLGSEVSDVGDVEWLSEDSEVASIDEKGRATATGSGSVRLRASLGDLEAEVILEVSPVATFSA